MHRHRNAYMYHRIFTYLTTRFVLYCYHRRRCYQSCGAVRFDRATIFEYVFQRSTYDEKLLIESFGRSKSHVMVKVHIVSYHRLTTNRSCAGSYTTSACHGLREFVRNANDLILISKPCRRKNVSCCCGSSPYSCW